MKQWRLRIVAELPSGNRILRYHWSKRKRVIEGWYWLLYKAGARKIPMAIRDQRVKRRVHVARYGHNEMDRPNVMMAADKLITDNLVRMNILVDDNPEWCFLECTSKIDRRHEPRVVVTVKNAKALDGRKR